MESTLFSLSALVALLPASIASIRRGGGRDKVFWILLAVAVAGPAVWAGTQMAGAWRTGLSTTLWVTVAASMAVFAVTAAVTRHAWRLTPLIGPYMVLLCVLAIVWQQAPAQNPLAADALGGWVAIHIAVSVATYALVTIAALSALGAFLQERALKTKHPTALTRLLPSVVDCERLLVRLLLLGEIVLGVGLLTGIGSQYAESGTFLALDHKTILSITTFVVIGGLLLAHFRTGVRGRMAARFVLLAYLLLTLGYPGIKFVTDILLA